MARTIVYLLSIIFFLYLTEAMTSFISSYADYVEPDRVELKDTPNIFEPCIFLNSRRRGKVKPYPLSEVEDLRVQEGLIIKDLLFAFLGHEGCYIRYSDKYDPADDNNRLKGPDFKIAKHLDVSLKTVTKRLVKYGKFYTSLSAFVELYDKKEYGTVIQSLCRFIGVFLQEYRGLVLRLEEDFKFAGILSLSMIENKIVQEISVRIEHLCALVATIHDENLRRSTLRQHNGDVVFSKFIENIKNDLKETGSVDLAADNMTFEYCKGGVILEIVQERINACQGDSVSSKYLKQMLESISIEYVKILNEWLINGEINDPFGEFLVKKNTFSDRAKIVKKNNIEKYWEELYMLRSDGIIHQLSSREIQHKILATGKYLNIFKSATSIPGFEQLEERIDSIESLYSQDLEYKINEYYKRANKMLLKLVLEGYDLQDLFHELQNIFMFRNSYAVDSFLDKSMGDLRRLRNAASSYRLSKVYHSVITDNGNFNSQPEKLDARENSSMANFLRTNISFSIDIKSFYELYKEILHVKSFDAEEAFRTMPNAHSFKNLLNRSLERERLTSAESNHSYKSSGNEDLESCTISGINLDLKLPFPLSIFVGQDAIFEYQLIFKLLIIIKFLSKFIDLVWKEINFSYVWSFPRFDLNTKKWILRCRILHNRMRDFINNLQFYLCFDIIEPKFEEISKSLLNTFKELQKEDIGMDIRDNKFDNMINKNMSLVNYSQNNLFDEKISRHTKNMDTSSDRRALDVHSWFDKMSSFLNDILRDSFVTNEALVEVVKNIFEVIFLYNNYLIRLKKSIILTNAELYEKFAVEFPEKFEGKDMTKTLIDQRFHNLNGMLNAHFQNFNDALTEFIETVRSVGNIENPMFLILIERLENCFPDH